jgi:CPA2 family monovalent cation:H+ antiporter-2
VFLELGMVVLGLSVLARLGGRLGLSPIPAYLLAGLAFGDGGLIPLVTTERFIQVGAEIGVVMLLLMLGMEFNAEELTAAVRTSAAAGIVDIVANFVPGVVAGLLLGWKPLAAVFLGGVTYISSSGIVAKLLHDLDWVANRETPVVLSILVFEDLTMVLYLPLVAALLLGAGTITTLVSVLIACGVVAATLVAALRFGPALSRLVFSRSDEVLLLAILGVTLVVAGVAARVQASAAVGAFLVGLGLSGEAAESARPLLRPVRDLFAAVFFFFFGLEIAPNTLPPVLVAAAVIAAVTAVTKFATGSWSARRAGVGVRARRRAGAALLARGEFSVVIAGLGASSGIEPTLRPLAAAYVLIMAVAGPLAARGMDVWGDRDRGRAPRAARV